MNQPMNSPEPRDSAEREDAPGPMDKPGYGQKRVKIPKAKKRADSVEISKQARAPKSVSKRDSYKKREALVEQIRAEIEQGTYNTPSRLEDAVERLSQALERDDSGEVEDAGDALTQRIKRWLDAHVDNEGQSQADGACLTLVVPEFVDEKEASAQIARLIEAMSAYHIALGGEGLVVDDWQTSVLAEQAVGVR